MTAGDLIPLHRQFTDEQIAEYKQRSLATLKKYSDTESIPQGDTSVHDILSAIHPWEFELERDQDGSPGMYGEYGYMRLEQACEQLEAGVEDWVVTDKPAWGCITDIAWEDKETPQRVEHGTPHVYVVPGQPGVYTAYDNDALAVFLTRTDTIVDETTAIEGEVLVGVSPAQPLSETRVPIGELLAAIDHLQRPQR